MPDLAFENHAKPITRQTTLFDPKSLSEDPNLAKIQPRLVQMAKFPVKQPADCLGNLTEFEAKWPVQQREPLRLNRLDARMAQRPTEMRDCQFGDQ